MGNCFGKSSAQRRHDNWKATGIVALRDGGLRSIPSNVLAIEGAVRTLDLSNNSIADLAQEELQVFSQLQRLVLARNRLAQLPRSIGSLVQLKHLALDANKLTQLPAELGQLQRLEVLLLQGNQLTALPDALESCKALKTLNVSGNKLRALPDALSNCSSLQVRCFDGQCDGSAILVGSFGSEAAQ
jgi:Leucine-rich repeat (LRR) protein